MAGNAALPSLRRGWFFVAILVGAYVLSFVDRQILNLLVGDLRHDLAISDQQVGLLQGPAFGLLYALMGMPFGWLADRASRFKVIAVGLLLWSLATFMGGMSRSFDMLFASRMLVGVGEAALVPAAVSLLSDSFAPHRRALPLAVFTSGVSLGAGLALVMSGALIRFARDGARELPMIGTWLGAHQPWQIVLMMAGMMGVPLAPFLAFLPDPVRRDLRVDPADSRLFPYLARHRRVFVPLFAAVAFLYIYSNGLASWLPSLFIRGFGWDAAKVGLRMGSLIMIGALTGNLVSGMIATRLVRGAKPGGTLITMALGAWLMVPCAVVAPLLAPAMAVAFGLMLVYFAISLCFGVATASFVAVTPAPIRGQMIALYLLIGNLFGLGLGPPFVVLMLDRVVANAARVGPALAIVGACSVLPGATFLLLAIRPHGRLAMQFRPSGHEPPAPR